MSALTASAAIVAVADHLTLRALPVSAPATDRGRVSALWRRALAARTVGGFEDFFVIIEVEVASRDRAWAIHRETGRIFDAPAEEAWLSWLAALREHTAS